MRQTLYHFILFFNVMNKKSHDKTKKKKREKEE